MRLTSVTIEPSPLGADRKRLVGAVEYESSRFSPETYWFDFPAACAQDIRVSGNPWVPCLLPMAVTLGEPLHLSLPVDRLLWENLHEIMTIWNAWYPQLKPVAVKAPIAPSSPIPFPDKRRIGAFFSGGVDSFFTAIRHDEPDAVRPPVDELITVWGFDIPLDAPEAFARARCDLAEASEQMNKKHIDIATNLRETALKYADWSHVWHGAAMASIALALESRYRAVLIAASLTYDIPVPWGSTPLTDPLFSTSHTRVIHDGCHSRAEKIDCIKHSQSAMDHLRVCWESRSDSNCMACGKCFRTALVLEACGALHLARRFPLRGDLASMARIVPLRDEDDFITLDTIKPMLLSKNRPDLADLVDVCIRRNRRRNRLIFVMKKLARQKVIGHVAQWSLRRLQS
ncbi:MAG TPA: hypothetical protein PKZ01_08965 [Candidatus Hydrogenedentes bacterium]|nr:hypothetical protein [Candidatus Hydrogenedentota bacterium]